MLVLGIDTSGKFGSIALAKCESDGGCNTIEVVPLQGGTFSAQLIPQIAALLRKHGFTKHDLDGFAVASGPGSFTGLRVGLSAVKALAEILHKPIAAVSLLEAIADPVKDRRVFAALDAGRGEVYVGEYENGIVAGAGEQLLLREDLWASTRGKALITPDQELAEAARAAGVQTETVKRPLCDAIARIGWRKIRDVQTVSPEDLEANYIRRSDAEIFSKVTP
jgi:tRNA threonylcarbamoyladenosine biosynthesis protein TsaB